MVRSLSIFSNKVLDNGCRLTLELTMNDILTLSPKFWEFHQDPLGVVDGAAMTLATIQVNLTAGTIARHATGTPELKTLVDKLLAYDIQ